MQRTSLAVVLSSETAFIEVLEESNTERQAGIEAEQNRVRDILGPTSTIIFTLIVTLVVTVGTGRDTINS